MDQNKGAGSSPPSKADMANRNDSTMTGAGARAEPAPDAQMQPWLRLAEQLTPLIGDSGFCVLFGRAVRLASARFDGLVGCDPSKSTSLLFASLTRTLNELGPEGAAAANAALLDTFTTQLGTLIGEALTKQLLHDAMGGDGQKNEQEQK